MVVEEYMKLEKIEFGGIQGRCLSEMVTHIFTEFQELTGKFSSRTYDALDVHNQVSECTISHKVETLVTFYLMHMWMFEVD